jgi:heme exporter protein A
LIETLKLDKAFGFKQVLRGITLEIGEGEVVALAGPNGAGKSTLMRILATLARPTRGRAAVNRIEIPDGAMEARGAIGYVGHRTLLYDDLTVAENLRFYARLYDVADADRRIIEVATRVGIDKRADDPVRTLSRGFQQRVSLARAILHRPKVYLFDEPWTGLDQNSGGILLGLFEQAGQEGAAVLFSTHEFERSLSVATRALVLRGGRLVYDGPRDAWGDAARFGAIYADALAQPLKGPG